MKVVLVAPPIMDYRDGKLCSIAMDAVRECPPYGIYYLAGILKEHGHHVVVADLIAAASNDLLPFSAEVLDADLLGIGATTLSWPTARDVIAQVRRFREDLPIVLGGIHPTMFDRHMLGSFAVQYVIRGEAERALPQLCRTLEDHGDLAAVPNLTWKDGEGRPVRNPLAPLMSGRELASFPLPDYGELPDGAYKTLSIESSRGCAFDCSFCSTSYRRSWRPLPAASFVDRLARVLEHVSRAQHQIIHIVDDEFSTNPRRVLKIIDLMSRRALAPQLVYDSRATDLLEDGFVSALAPFTHRLLVGAECGYDEGLRRVGKGTSCEILENAAATLYRYGMSERADFSFILGLPWETRSEVEKTIRFAMRLLGKYGVRVLMQWYSQIPGSRLWEEQRRNQVVTETMYDDYGFFRNLYLFRSGVPILPQDIWDITDLLDKLLFVTRATYRDDDKRIEFALPDPIYSNFPLQNFLSSETGLESLRQVSQPPVSVETPLRRIS
jgi:anaerobic magnesium-protoporphyrin IX monomethyl ester cyclase